MNHTHRYELRVARLSVLAGIISIASIFLMAAAANFNTAAFTDPQLLLGMTTADSQMLKWSMIADMLGFYLLLLPALFYFHQYLKTRTPWSYLVTWCGSAYILIGAIGAAILSVVWPANIVEYPIATAAQQEAIGRSFDLASQIVYSGMWNTLEVLLAGAWWLGIGVVLKKEQPAFGLITITLGLASVVDGIGNMTGIAPMAELGLNIYLIVGMIWPVWFGAYLLTKRKQKLQAQRQLETVSAINLQMA